MSLEKPEFLVVEENHGFQLCTLMQLLTGPGAQDAGSVLQVAPPPPMDIVSAPVDAGHGRRRASWGRLEDRSAARRYSHDEVPRPKITINTMVDQLNSFTNEVTRLAREVGAEGNPGRQAVELASRLPDLVVPDLMVRRMRGCGVLRQVKHAIPNVKVAMLTRLHEHRRVRHVQQSRC